jgi:diguanylate cyclase (GGDEF)-like protein/PAS domain S-box-containing protein
MSSMNEENDELRQFLHLAPVGLIKASLNGEVSLMNSLAAQLLVPLAPTRDLSNLYSVLAEHVPELQQLVARFLPAQGRICDGLRIGVDAGVSGRREPQVIALTVTKLGADLLMASVADITQQVKRQLQQAQSDAWVNAILTGVSDHAVLRVDKAGTLIEWNAGAGQLTGLSREAVLGKPASVFFPENASTIEHLSDRLREAEIGGWSLEEGWLARADGSRFWGSTMFVPLHPVVEQDSKVVTDGSETVEKSYCLVIRDISDRLHAADQLRKATACDHLTGIANRRTFFEAAELEVARWHRVARPLSLLMFDADHFKKINDEHGHPAGDKVLKHLAGLLTATFRLVDLPARVGGEEFAVLLPSADIGAAVEAANRLRQRVETTVCDVDGLPIRYTVSGGVATMEAGMAGLEELMKRADRALYAAKAGGRNRIASFDAGTE